MKKLFWKIGTAWVLGIIFCGLSLQVYGAVTEQWVKSYDGKDNDFGQAVAVDSKNNIIAVVQTLNAGNWDCSIIKYDPSGNILWKKVYDSRRNDYGCGVALDTRDNIIVVGYSYNGTNVDGFVIKYDTKGDSIFVEKYDSGNDDFFAGVATDSKDCIITTGYFSNGVNSDYLIIKYNHIGNKQWVRTYDGGGTDRASGVAIDNKDNVFVAGTSAVVYDDYLTLKYDSKGNLLWTKFYDNGRYSNDSAYGIAVDSEGSIIVVGITSSGFLPIKYDSDGILQWTKPTTDLPNGDWIASVRSVRVSQDGNIVMAGYSHNGSNFDCFVMKYKPNGEMIWFKTYNSNWDEFGIGICTDKQNNIIVTGRSFINGLNWDQVIIKYKEE